MKIKTTLANHERRIRRIERIGRYLAIAATIALLRSDNPANLEWIIKGALKLVGLIIPEANAHDGY